MNKKKTSVLYGINFNKIFNKIARLAGTIKEGKEWDKVCVHGVTFDEACDGCKNIDKFVIRESPLTIYQQEND